MRSTSPPETTLVLLRACLTSLGNSPPYRLPSCEGPAECVHTSGCLAPCVSLSLRLSAGWCHVYTHLRGHRYRHRVVTAKSCIVCYKIAARAQKASTDEDTLARCRAGRRQQGAVGRCRPRGVRGAGHRIPGRQRPVARVPAALGENAMGSFRRRHSDPGARSYGALTGRNTCIRVCHQPFTRPHVLALHVGPFVCSMVDRHTLGVGRHRCACATWPL